MEGGGNDSQITLSEHVIFEVQTKALMLLGSKN